RPDRVFPERWPSAPHAAARALARANNLEKEAIAESASACVEFQPKLTRRAQRAMSSLTPMAASTCEGFTLPDEQAAPELIITPSRSSAMTAVSARMPGSAKLDVFARRGASWPKMMASG